jgi:hypothetical protein
MGAVMKKRKKDVKTAFSRLAIYFRIKDIEQYSNEFYKNIPHTNPKPLTMDTIKIKKQEILSVIKAKAQEKE